jgi:hypothetical protein
VASLGMLAKQLSLRFLVAEQRDFDKGAQHANPSLKGEAFVLGSFRRG